MYASYAVFYFQNSVNNNVKIERQTISRNIFTVCLAAHKAIGRAHQIENNSVFLGKYIQLAAIEYIV